MPGIPQARYAAYFVRRNGAARRMAVASSGAHATSIKRQTCRLGGRPAAARASAKAAACAANSSTVGTGTTIQPSAMRAARAIPAGTWEPTRIGGRGRWSGRGRMLTPSSCQWRP